MRGTFSKLPADTLAAALAPVADRCLALAWAIAIQSGPIRYGDDTDALGERWIRFAPGDIGPNGMMWLERGFLPTLADKLILDEWSYYLGFDPYKISPDMLATHLSHQLHPRPLLFETIIRFNLLYILRVDEGWWEAYSANGGVLRQLREGWGGTYVDSERWDGENVIYPGPNATT